jgi:hypothetical protein
METKMGNNDIYQFTNQLSFFFSYTKPHRGYSCDAGIEMAEFLAAARRQYSVYCTKTSTHPQVDEMSHKWNI